MFRMQMIVQAVWTMIAVAMGIAPVSLLNAQVVRVFNAADDFSNTQGFHNWYYLDWTGSRYDTMTYGTNWWGGTTWHGDCSRSECHTGCIDSVLWEDGGSTRGSGASCGHAPTLAWVSPTDGLAHITGNARKCQEGGGGRCRRGHPQKRRGVVVCDHRVRRHDRLRL